MAAGLLFLVCSAAVLCSAEAQESYDGLPDIYKKGVDLAMKLLSTRDIVQHHFRFLRSVQKLESEGESGAKYFYHHFHLKPTTCPRGTTESDSQRCAFRNDKPLMDCAVCYKARGDQMEVEPQPYVHCIHKLKLTEEMKERRFDHFNKMRYHSGAPTILSRRTS